MKPAFAWILLLALLQGCALLTPPEPEESEPEAVQPEPSVIRHLRYIDRLNQSTVAQLDEEYERSTKAFEQRGSIRNRLHLAWLWATPGHSRSNLWAARKQLAEILENERLSDELARLVRVQLHEVEHRLKLDQRLQEADAKIRALTTLEHSMEERDSQIQEPTP